MWKKLRPVTSMIAEEASHRAKVLAPEVMARDSSPLYIPKNLSRQQIPP